MSEESRPDSLPIPFAWQDPQWQRVCQQRIDYKLPHALLLAGPKGVGKFVFASALGGFMLCRSPVNQVPCGRCKGCELNLAGTHPDLMLLRPEEKSRVIKIDQVRRLTDFFAKTSQQGGTKVALIEPVEALNINAANALLKSLEEPSGDSLLLLVSHVPSQVMATIRSRCQQLSFSVPATEESLSWLTPLAVGQDAGYLLSCAGGAPLTALGLLKGDALEQRQTLAQSLLGLGEDRLSALEVAAGLQTGEPLEVVESIMQWLQAGVRERAFAGEVEVASEHDHEQLEPRLLRLIGTIQEVIVFRFWDKLVAVKRQLVSAANPNKQLLLEELMMDWQALTRQSSTRTHSRQRIMNGLV